MIRIDIALQIFAYIYIYISFSSIFMTTNGRLYICIYEIFLETTANGVV